MDIEYIKDNYKFETLTEKHDLSNFECGSDDLNDFEPCRNPHLKYLNCSVDVV